ncbi:MAG: hypothetical protein IKO36_08925 [Bacteroidaceae bacterium]|nr:hypothetical protein [Bacteroidaceae bacterium]
MFDSYFEMLGKRIEEAGKLKSEAIKKAVYQIMNTDNIMEIICILDSFDKDEVISITGGLALKMKEMKKDMERFEDDGK